MCIVSDLDWEHLFGSTARFAVRAGLGRSTERQLAKLEIYVRHRSITANQHGVLGVQAAVVCDPADLLCWLVESLPFIAKGEEFPFLVNRTRSAADWLVRSLDITDDQAELESRFEWWSRHCLSAVGGTALPYVVFRRVINDIEISWTDRLGTVRPDIRWSIHEGAERLSLVEVLHPFLDLAEALATRLGSSLDSELVERARSLNGTVAVSQKPFSLAASGTLQTPTKRDLSALERLVREARLSSGTSAWTPHYEAPDIDRPWLDGYRLAQTFREERGLGTKPLHDVEHVMRDMGIDVGELELSDAGLHGVSLAGPGYRPSVRINKRSQRAARSTSRHMLLAHELCHLLHDWRPGEEFSLISSERADWPTEARANAFAAELMMPRDALRTAIGGRHIDIHVLREITRDFQVGLQAAILHLRNIGLLTETQGDALYEELLNPAERPRQQ